MGIACPQRSLSLVVMANKAISKVVSENATSQSGGLEAIIENSEYDHLLRYASYLTHNSTEAEEITQTAYLRYLSIMERNHWKVEIRNVQAYLRSIARNLCNDMWMQGRVTVVSYDDNNIRKELETSEAKSNDSVTSIENRIYFEELYRALPLNVILGGCSEYEMELLQLNAIDEMSPEEIAQIVGKEVSQVRYDLQKNYAKIRYRVRKLINKTGDDNLF